MPKQSAIVSDEDLTNIVVTHSLCRILSKNKEDSEKCDLLKEKVLLDEITIKDQVHLTKEISEGKEPLIEKILSEIEENV